MQFAVGISSFWAPFSICRGRENKYKTLFGILRIFVLARFGVRRRLNKTFNIYRRLFTFAVGIFFFSFASRRRRRFCFVRHLLNLGDNTLLQIN